MMDELKKLLPAPERPKQSNIDWQATEHELGTRLPSDYKRFVEVYGAGRIDDFLGIYTPFAQRKSANLLDQLRVERDRFRYIVEAGNEELPYEIFPAETGLLPVGRDENGNVIFWKTSNGNPELWPLVVIPARSDHYEEFTVGLVEFIMGVLEKRISVKCYPSDFPNERRHQFIPSR